MYKKLVNEFAATQVGSWVARMVASRVDPWIYRRTRGLLSATLIPATPQLVLTTKGRHSGAGREAQLAYMRDGHDFIVVGSNFGMPWHPHWSENLLASAAAQILVGAEELPVNAETIGNPEKGNLWPRLDAVAPQLHAYRRRTSRDIRMFRLKPVRAA